MDQVEELKQTGDKDTIKGRPRFPIVGIGASAGGLEALKEFFAGLPADSGMAFIIIQHLVPTHESRMAEILAKYTPLKVIQAEEGMVVEPNMVITNPPGRNLRIQGGKLTLGKSITSGHLEAAIDEFLSSLADDWGPQAIGIILSGSSGKDGPRGIRAVRAAGGLCLAQEPATAQFTAMPQAAIETGLVDLVLPPQAMPEAMQQYVQNPQVRAADREEAPSEAAASDLEKILKLLRLRTRSDFHNYKQTTVLRRIQRRMGLRQIANTADYTKLLQQDALELEQLARDMLIGVSSFFRDPEAFAELKAEVITPLVQEKDDEAPLRAWVAGCATGEEAYSIAILLMEARSEAGKNCPIQVFATDIDDQALETARAGIYPPGIAHDITPERLEAYFTRRQDSGYQVSKHLRDAVIFSRHNLLFDPPFSRLDLVSCRNVLIYLEPEAQKRILALFGFALNSKGGLLLGKSEGVSGREDLYESVSRPNRIYRLIHSHRQTDKDYPFYQGNSSRTVPERKQPEAVNTLRQANLEVILHHFAAAVLLVEPEGKILYFHGETEKYLGHPKGLASLNLLDMTSGTLSARLRRAMEKALQQDQPFTVPGVALPRTGAPLADLTIMRVSGRPDGPRLLAIIFEDAHPAGATGTAVPMRGEDEPLVAQLEEEIKAIRTELKSNAEGFDTTTEELKAANEEVMSMNEELQSANEELEASKEELQSLNEELTTVNSQLNDNVLELMDTNNDLANLLKATEIATVFLDPQLRIRRFTPKATELLNLIESDMGRPVSHITQNFTGVDLSADAQVVLQSLTPLEKEVQTHEGRWYTIRILPYRTLDDRIDGTVVTFSDVNRLKETESYLRYEKTYAQNIVDSTRDPLLVLDEQLQILSANPAFYKTFQVSAPNIIGKQLYEIGNRQWDIPALRDILPEVAGEGRTLDDYEVRHDFPGLGSRTMLLNARRVESEDKLLHRVLLGIEDITGRRAEEVQLQRLSDRLADSNRELEQFGYIISHDLQEPLRVITGFLKLLQKEIGEQPGAKTREYMGFIIESADQMGAMIKDLLELSRLGREQEGREMLDLAGPLEQALKNLQHRIEESGARITHDALPNVRANALDMVRLFQNLIGNAIKFRQKETPPEIHVGAAPHEKGWRLWVRDNGIGIDMVAADRIFRVFQRLHSHKQYEDTGIGLAACKKIVERHGGRIWLESVPGQGSSFNFTLPAGAETGAQDRV